MAFMQPPAAAPPAPAPLAPSDLGLAEVRSVLVIHFRYLGDMVLLAALFHNLRLHLPTARITALADTAYTEILCHVPNLDEALPFPRQETRRGPLLRRWRAMAQLVRQLRARQFDMVIDVTNTRTSQLLVSLLKPRLRVGYAPQPDSKRSWRKPPYNVFATPFTRAVPHYIDHYLNLIQALGLPILERVPTLRPRPEDMQAVARLLREQGLTPQTFVVMHPGARVARKCWPPPRFAGVIDALEHNLGLRTVLIGGPGEQVLRDAIAQEGKTLPVDFVDQLSLGQLIALLASCRLFIGNDSGPMHMAAAVGTPVVALFGSSKARFWAPLGPAHIVLTREQECHCGTDMKRPTACDVEGPQCLKQITVAEVVAATRQSLNLP